MDKRVENRKLMENFTKKLVSESDKDSYGEVPNDILNDMKDAYYGIGDHVADLGRAIKQASQHTTKMAAFKNDWKAWQDLKKAFDKLTMGKYL